MPSTKERVFELLQQAKGEFVSGAAISEQLQISRTAVWKGIQSLRQEGCRIEAVTNQGYRLLPAQQFSPLGLRQQLKGEFFEKIIFLDSVSSTNDYLKSHPELPDRTLVFAQKQTMGRGKSHGSFESPAGEGLYFSFLLRPRMTFHQIGQFRTHVLDSICEAVEQLCGISLQLDPPNVLLYQGKKVCGILLEVSVESETGEVDSLIGGIGIYVSHIFPEGASSTSLQAVSGKEVSRLSLAAGILNRLAEKIQAEEE